MIATGSGLDRFVNCRASSALPRVWSEVGTAARLGTAIHAYLEALANGAPPEDALLVVHALTFFGWREDDNQGGLRGGRRAARPPLAPSRSHFKPLRSASSSN